MSFALDEWSSVRGFLLKHNPAYRRALPFLPFKKSISFAFKLKIPVFLLRRSFVNGVGLLGSKQNKFVSDFIRTERSTISR